MTICHAINWIFVIGIRITPNNCVQKDVSRRKWLKLVAIVIITLYLEDWIWNVSGSENIDIIYALLLRLVFIEKWMKLDAMFTENQRVLLRSVDGSRKMKNTFAMLLPLVLKRIWKIPDATFIENQEHWPNNADGL